MPDWGKIGYALGGMGAGFQGQGTQWQLLHQRQQQARAAEEEKRRMEKQQRELQTKARAANTIRQARRLAESGEPGSLVRADTALNSLMAGIPGAATHPRLLSIKQQIAGDMSTGVMRPGARGNKDRVALELRTLEDEFVNEGLLPPETAPEPYTLAPGAKRYRGSEVIAENQRLTETSAGTDIGKLTQDYRAGLIPENVYLQRLDQLAISDDRTPDEVEKSRLELERLRRETDPDQATAQRVYELAEKENLRTLNTLAEGAEGRQLNIDKAREFYDAINSGRRSSGAWTQFSDWIVPGKWSDQAKFNQAFDAFAEVAARQQLKANGEIRPTDADVEGMKRAMFGVGREPLVNLQLLDEYIRAQQSDEDMYQNLLTARTAGRLGDYVPDIAVGPSSAPSYNPTDEGQEEDQEGDTATNPQTGERMIFRNGKWRPL